MLIEVLATRKQKPFFKRVYKKALCRDGRRFLREMRGSDKFTLFFERLRKFRIQCMQFSRFCLVSGAMFRLFSLFGRLPLRLKPSRFCWIVLEFSKATTFGLRTVGILKDALPFLVKVTFSCATTFWLNSSTPLRVRFIVGGDNINIPAWQCWNSHF